jgi:hypothetical protein
VDPHHFKADPDLAFHFNADPFPTCHCNADLDPALHQSDANPQSNELTRVPPELVQHFRL